MKHYFTNDFKGKSNIKVKEIIIKKVNLKFYTDNGIFSKRGLDYGTRLLLESINEEKLTGRILDFGCGYGPIGIYLKKVSNSIVDMIDINIRAIELAKKNALLNKVEVNIFESDIYQNINQKYNFIISNPPIRVGKKILYQILLDAKKFLINNGELWIVINKNQGAKTIVKDLEKHYNVKIISKSNGFYIICAVNN